ncbi:MAG: ATP-binding cassette domain-containing protein [Anaerolineae bacterium]|nr:ATP-binding cassette domain-containing protein [Anaerolineae bacterium]
MPLIALRDVTFAYPGKPPIFERFGWRVEQGEVWTVLGPSGCGKSTLLMLLAGLARPQQGMITIAGDRLPRPRPRTGLVLQDYGLLPWATVRENVSLGLRIRQFYGPDGRHVPAGVRIADGDAETLTARWLARLGLEAIAEQYPGQISGGQRQRVAIARTLALTPDLLLMDEPFSALDAPTRESLQQLTLDLCEEAGLTVVLVTHNIEEAIFVGQHVLRLATPPNTALTVVSNPHHVDTEYRRSVEYAAACAHLRQGL